MNSDQLLHALADCAQASTHEPDAETINNAADYIMQLERENHNQDLTIDEKNERIAQLEAQLAAYANYRQMTEAVFDHIAICGICRTGGICEPFGMNQRTDYAVVKMNLDEALK